VFIRQGCPGSFEEKFNAVTDKTMNAV